MAFCGSVGSIVRSEYAIVGDSINLAARFMGLAKPREIIIDSATKAAVDGHFKLDSGTQVRVKGEAQPVSMFRVLGTASKHHGAGDACVPVGQEAEQVLKTFHELENYILSHSKVAGGVKNGGPAQLLTIQGPAGTGKTALVEHFRCAFNCPIVNAHTDVVESETPYYALKSMMLAKFKLLHH